MAHVHFKLPDELVRDAREAGISIAATTERALRDALAGRAAEASQPALRRQGSHGADARDRYAEGWDLGSHWVNASATVAEIAALAALRSSRWRDLGIDTRSHSLGNMLVELGELLPDPDGKAWLERGPFAEGIIDAAAEAIPA